MIKKNTYKINTLFQTYLTPQLNNFDLKNKLTGETFALIKNKQFMTYIGNKAIFGNWFLSGSNIVFFGDFLDNCKKSITYRCTDFEIIKIHN